MKIFNKNTILLLIMFLSPLPGKQEGNLNYRITAPRTGFFQDQRISVPVSSALGEPLHSGLFIHYGYDWSPNLTFTTDMETGTRDFFFNHAQRLYQFKLSYKTGAYHLNVGRLLLRNNLWHQRIDGLSFQFKIIPGNTIQLSAGNIVRFYLQPEYNGTDKLWLGSWKTRISNGTLTAQFWHEDLYNKGTDYTGFRFRFRKTPSLYIRGQFYWNLTENTPTYQRLIIRSDIGRNTFTLGYRRFQSMTKADYPWLQLDIDPPGAVYFSWSNQISENINLFQTIHHRVTDTKNFEFESTLLLKNHEWILSWFEDGTETLIGGGYTGRISQNNIFELGYSLMFNKVYSDYAVNDVRETGLSVWTNLKPNENLAVKLYIRYSNNPYYQTDGRGGMEINYAF